MITSYLAVALGVWGRGPTEDEARSQCRKAGASKNERMIIYENTRDDDQDPPYVDYGGSSCFFGKLVHIATYEKNRRTNILPISNGATTMTKKPETQTDKLNKKNAKAIARAKKGAEESAALQEAVRNGELTAGEALQAKAKMTDKTKHTNRPRQTGPEKRTPKPGKQHASEKEVSVVSIERMDDGLHIGLSDGKMFTVHKLTWVHHSDPKCILKSIAKLELNGKLFVDKRNPKEAAAFVKSEQERYNKLAAAEADRRETLKPHELFEDEPKPEQKTRTPKPKAEPKGPVEKDQFGCRKDSQAAKINDCITNKGITLEQISKITGVNIGRVKGHLKAMVAKGFVVEKKDKYILA